VSVGAGRTFLPPLYPFAPTLVRTAQSAAFQAQGVEEIQIPQAHLCEAILLGNRGVDEAVRGLERLKGTKDSQLDSSSFDEELVLFEDHRTRLNSYFCSTIQRSEQQDAVRYENRYRAYEENTLDEVQVYRDVRMVEDRRRVEGKPPKVRFFTPKEQREWERQCPTPRDAQSEPQSSGGDQP
jgi:hypothetical protein